jgi:AraC-like DNA-binding protein
MNAVGLISIRAAPIRVSIEPPHEFVGLTVPLDRPFMARDRGISRVFDRNQAHLFDCKEIFDFQAKNGCGVLGANFKITPLLNYARRLNQSESLLTVEPCLSLHAPAGINLQRALAKVWSEIESTGGAESALAEEELEDELIAAFILAADFRHDGTGRRNGVAPHYLNLAEEYLLANLDKAVTRDKLAEYTGVSIRTLSRAFLKKYGIGPIGFLKQRRLDAAYRALTGAEPGSCSVTEVAVRYGFNHLGKFAVEYRRTFGESPSVSLTH